MDVKRFFNGVAVIIDDQIDDKESEIYQIRNNLINNNIPVLPFDRVPSQEIISSLSSVSFIILDWDFFHGIIGNANGDELDPGIILPEELGKEEENRLITFIRKLLKSIFVPIFIFTSKPIDGIQSKLVNESLYFQDKPNRLFIKSKGEVLTEDDLFATLDDWLNDSPSAYVLKAWNETIVEARNDTFIELYNCSPNWVKLIWETIKNDSIDSQEEFGAFLTKNLINHIKGYSFQEEVLDRSVDGNNEKDIISIIEKERFVRYESQPNQAYTGDLFKISGGKYFLNIRAQCDLSRIKKQTNEYAPELFGIEGEVLNSKDIVSSDIRLTSEGQLVFENQEPFSLDALSEICRNDEELIAFNGKFRRYRNKVFFQNGTFIGRSDKIIICCIDGKRILQFDLNLKCRSFAEIKDKRVGRILPPYITQIQQKCSAYLIREGTIPTPQKIIEDFSN
ncbi:MAG: hypothetical protein J6Z04_05490 [Clostridia bacterium]|nr:hypothetical protein [Clostridia bacterium]